MRIPGNELHYSHLRTYGAGGLDLDGTSEPGCPDLYFHRYVKHDIPEIQRRELSYGLVIHEALFLMEEESIGPDEALQRAWDPKLGVESYEEAERDLRKVVERGGLNLHTVAVEQALSCHLYDDEKHGEIRFGGRIDWLGVDANVGDEAVLYFTDYKTDRRPPSRRDALEWKQGWGYALLVWENREQYLPGADDVKIVGVYDAIKHYPLYVEYTPEMIERFRHWAAAVARTILVDTKHEPVLNPNCGWCPIRVDCKLWVGLPGDGEVLLDRLSKRSIKQRGEWLEEAKELRGRLNKAIDDTQEALKQHCLTKGTVPLGDDREYWVDQGEKREVDPGTLFQIIGDDVLDMVTVSMKEMDAWAEDHLDVDLSPAIRSVPGSLSLKVRKRE